MVRLERVNKYFFKGRRNEIHAIDDTSLEMGEKGLVALLGPSGCGKTTLLNAIGGLDKTDGGRIYVNGERITGRPSWVADRIRTLNIGYVFQNYNLVENMTVFDNVAIALKMSGTTDREEIERKVSYVLEKVGMYRCRNRYAEMLSGGERQRVGIARAIVRDPAIVIADEPTGNLDSRNTLEVMNIIRAIAEERLVILVTHEEKLAGFYASRIIRLKDGKVVSDEANTRPGSLDYRVENKIYLKDIKDHKRLLSSGYNVDFYNDDGSGLDIDIVLKNGSIYIRANGPGDRIEVIGENSGAELIDGHYRGITEDEALKYDFDLDELKGGQEKKYRSILNPLTLLKRGFRTVSAYSTLKKLLLVGFAAAAMFITYAISMFFGVMDISEDEFADMDRAYLTVAGKNIDADSYLEYENSGDYSYVMPGNSRISLKLPFDDYMQTASFSAVIDGSLSDAGKLQRSDMIYGRNIASKGELIIDRTLLRSVIEDQDTVEAGAGRVKDFLDRTIPVDNVGDFKIVGICDMGSPCIYADRDEFIDIIANSDKPGGEAAFGPDSGQERAVRTGYMDYENKKDEVSLQRGHWPEKDYQVVVNDKNRDDKAYGIGKALRDTVNGHRLKVVGYYSDAYDSDYMLVNAETVKYDLISRTDDLTLCPINKKASLRQLREEGVNVRDAFRESRDRYIKERWSSMKSMLVMAGIILAISFIEICLMVRASFLSRIREVGVYRAIGVKKADIYRMFSGEIIAVTTLAGLPGFALMAFVLTKLSKIPYLSDMIMVNSTVIIISLALIYGLNLLFGLLPVWKTIRKTPAEILSRTDIN